MNTTCIRWLLQLCVSGSVVVLAAGCGRSPTVPMAGQITLDGAALPTGTIVLTTLDGTPGPSVGCGIVDGRYSIPADRGPLRGVKYHVEIRSIDPNSASMKDPIPIFRDRVPAAYNSKSQLELAIPNDSTGVEKDFQLRSHTP
jgi:hypothetical protein